LVDHLERQAEARDLRPDHAARARVLVEHGDVVTERGQVARDGERRRASADADDFLAVLLLRRARHRLLDVRGLVIGGDTLEAADGDRFRLRLVFFLDAAAAAGGLARAVAGAAEDAREHVRFPVDHVGIGVAAGGDQADVFGNGRMRRAGPLAIHYFVEV